MDSPFVSMLPFVAFWVWLLALYLRRPNCPDCGTRLPAFQSASAKTSRQWLEGGFRCEKCSCETNTAGKKVAPGGNNPKVARRMHIVAIALPTAAFAVSLAPLLLRLIRTEIFIR
jgi:hypothetical protein